MQKFITKESVQISSKSIRENAVWRNSKESSYHTVSLRKFLWSNTQKLLNETVQSQKLLNMSHVVLKCLEILGFKDDLQRISNYCSEKTRFPN